MIIQLNYGQLKRIVEQVIKENSQRVGKRKRIMEQEDPYKDKNYVKPLLDRGFTIVDSIDIPDGRYQYVGGGYQFNLYDPSTKKAVPYIVITINGFKGGKNEVINVDIVGGQVRDHMFKPYKILRMPNKG